MTVQTYMADRIAQAGRLLAHFLETTPEDRRNWIPVVEGAAGLRSIHDQVSECIHVNRMVAELLSGQEPQWRNPIEAERPWTDDADAGELLIGSADALAEAVRSLSDDDLAREFRTRRGTMPGHVALELPYRNMHYHGGQINLLQLLYGDTEFRVPPPRG